MSKVTENPVYIPNALSITINTSVPGNQTIKYKPNMTIKNTDDTTVWFDPLVPLNESTIDKVPENIRVLEFFNKGLYESLINAHGNKKQITLEQAKKNKIIDNNIQIVLNYLFPTSGILYIKGEPYSIADVQWTKGDWKIDRKIKDVPEVDVNKISDPITYNALIKNEIISGYNQLENLPKDLIYGSNFDKSKEEISLMDKEKKINDNKKAEEARKFKELEEIKRLKELEETRRLKDIEATRLKELEENRRLRQLEENRRLKELEEIRRLKELEENRRLRELEENKRLRELEEAKLKIIKPAPLAIEDAPEKNNPPLAIENGPEKNNPPLEIENGPEKNNPPLEIEEIKNIQMFEDYKPKLKISQNSTKTIRKYFGSDIFYSMINMIYKYMKDAEKFFIKELFKNTTNIDVKGNDNISKAAYLFTITGTKNISSNGVMIKKDFTDGLRVITNQGGGNCMFLAVADAINHYNYYNDIGNKIVYNIYGNGNNLFTSKNLRNIVSTEIIKLLNSDNKIRTDFLDTSKINVDLLNDEFENIINKPESQAINTPEYYNSTLLNLYMSQDNFFVIIPDNIVNRNRPFQLVSNDDEIKKYIESDYYWADQKTIDIFNKVLKLNIIVIDNTSDKFTIPAPTIKSDDNNTWDKYLFIYHYTNHYELITFDYLNIISSKVVKIKKTIFNRGSDIIPPFYIIFLLFSTIYIKLTPDDKDMITLFLNFFKSIQNSFDTIMSFPVNTDKNIDNFITNFQNYFGEIKKPITGGNNYNSSKFLKKEGNQDNIQISFHITIDMELQKGKTLSKEQISNLKCVKGWNKIRKSFSDFTGRKYVIPPIYENLSDKYNKEDKEDKKDKNNTKKIISGGVNKGKRRNKTFKYLK
jgi:hypothetical protein